MLNGVDQVVDGQVEVHLFAAAKSAVGRATVTAAPGSVAAILDDLTARHPGFAAVRPQCSYLVDGLSATPADPVPAGGRLDVLPPFAGG